MKALFFAILRTSLVIAIGMIASAAIALWMFSGEIPTSVRGFKEATNDLANFHQVKKQMVEKSFSEAEKIKDDFELPAGFNAETQAAAEEEAAILAKLNEEIAAATKDAARERELLTQKEILVMKNKLARLQTQLDRIENQNRALTLKISKLIKDTRSQKE